MTSANELLSAVRTSGVEIWAEQGKLRLRGPRDALPPTLMEALVTRKVEILQLLEIDATRLELPLSQAQLAVWQAYRTAPQSPAYNVNTVLELQRDHQHALLEQAFERVVARHAGLRCVFAERDDGSVIQRVQPAGRFVIERRQTSDAPGQHQAAVAEAIDRPFRLEHETALRVVVLSSARRAQRTGRGPAPRGLRLLGLGHPDRGSVPHVRGVVALRRTGIRGCWNEPAGEHRTRGGSR